MKWTSQAEEAMKKSGIAGLEVFYEKQNKQVSFCFQLVLNDWHNEWIYEWQTVSLLFVVEFSSQDWEIHIDRFDFNAFFSWTVLSV